MDGPAPTPFTTEYSATLEDGQVETARPASPVEERMSLPEHAVLLASVALPIALLVAFFSVAGFGDGTYVALTALDWPWYAFHAGALFIALLLWLLDARHWTHRRAVLARNVAVAVGVVGVGVGCSLATKVYPFSPLLFAMAIVPCSVLAARRTLLAPVASWRFFGALSLSLGVVAVATLLHFVLWVFVLPPPASRLATGWQPGWTNMWGGDVKRYWRHRLQCAPEATGGEAGGAASGGAEPSDGGTDAAALCYEAAFLWCFLPLPARPRPAALLPC